MYLLFLFICLFILSIYVFMCLFVYYYFVSSELKWITQKYQ